MKIKLTSVIVFSAFIAMYITSCTDNVSPNLEESLELYSGLEEIPEASNTTLNINRGSDLKKDGYFQITISGAKPNKSIKNIQTEAWCLEWKKPINSNNDVHAGVKWYSTETNEKWKPLNYFFSIRHELQKEDSELTNKEIQAVIWTIAGYMKIAPEFNVDQLSDSELPSRLRTNGVANFSRDKVKDITSRVLSEYSADTKSIPFSLIAETSHDQQDIVVPPPPPPVIDIDTKIFIYFDASGSMNSTLFPLRTMRNQLLKDALLPLYENDSDAYDENVTIIDNWSDERTFRVLNLDGATPEGNVIALAFQDEAATNYHSSFDDWDENDTRTSLFDTDITDFRNRLASFPSDYYRGVIFQVTNTVGPWGPNFKRLIESVENGLGNYAGNFGLSDRNEIEYIYDVDDGDSPQVYTDLVIQALEDFGFDLTPPTP